MKKGLNTDATFDVLAGSKRRFAPARRALFGHTPTIAITPVADGRKGAYESNVAGTWRMAERVYNLIAGNVALPDGTPARVVVAPEIVYGARTGARAQEYYTAQGVSANIWVSRSWAYNDELMTAAQGIGSSEWQQAAYGLNQTDRPGAVWLKAFTAAMDEKKRPIFAIYNPDLEKEDGDLMIGNPGLAKADLEAAQGYHAIAAGTQGQRQWTDLYPNFDMTESILCSSFDWDGFRAPMVVATENDSKNAMGMLIAQLLTGMPQLFADIRTNWTPESIRAATGQDISGIAPQGLIDKRNSGAGSLDYAVDVFSLVKNGKSKSIQQVATGIRTSEALQQRLIKAAIAGTRYHAAVLEYFPGDGLSSHYRTPGGIPMTAYRYNVVGDRLTCSVVEGDTVELPGAVADHISTVTDKTWPESFWAPRGMSSFEYMSRIGPNHDGNSFGHIGADMLTLNAMLRIPADLHNVPEHDVFRPTLWDRFGGDDFRACEDLGPLYA